MLKMSSRSTNIKKYDVSDTTINIPRDFSTVSDAISYLECYHITKQLTIKISDGTYTQSTINQNLEDRYVRLIGNITHPENVVLKFNNAHGISIIWKKLVYLDGMTLTGNDNTSYSGIYLTNSSLYCGSSVIINHFGDGVNALEKSFINGEYIKISNCALTGIRANFNSHAWIQRALVRYCGQFGITAEHGAMIQCNDSTSEYNTQRGITCWNARIYATNSISRNNGGTGFYVGMQGALYNVGGSALNNTGIGYHAEIGSTIQAQSTTSTGNSSAYSPAINTVGNQNSYIYK